MKMLNQKPFSGLKIDNVVDLG